MAKRVHVILLCEDTQQETFVRRFLKKRGVSHRQIRVIKAPGGRGAASHFVQQRFPQELKAFRSRFAHIQSLRLLVLIDGDQYGVQARKNQLDQACHNQQVAPRGNDEKVAIFVPTWSIETWFAFLEGKQVQESSPYPRLATPGLCQWHVDSLWEWCQERRQLPPPPPSLQDACQEYRQRVC